MMGFSKPVCERDTFIQKEPCPAGSTYHILEALYGVNLVTDDQMNVECANVKECNGDDSANSAVYDLTQGMQDYCDSSGDRICSFWVNPTDSANYEALQNTVFRTVPEGEVGDPCVGAAKSLFVRAICKATPAPTTSHPTPEVDLSVPTPEPTPAPPAHGTVSPVPFWSCRNKFFSEAANSEEDTSLSGLQCDEGYRVVVNKTLVLNFANTEEKECESYELSEVDDFKKYMDPSCSLTSNVLDAEKMLPLCATTTNNGCYDHNTFPNKDGVSEVFQNVFSNQNKNADFVDAYVNFWAECHLDSENVDYKAARFETDQKAPVFHGTYTCEKTASV